MNRLCHVASESILDFLEVCEEKGMGMENKAKKDISFLTKALKYPSSLLVLLISPPRRDEFGEMTHPRQSW